MTSRPGCELIVVAIVVVPLGLTIAGSIFGHDKLKDIGGWIIGPLAVLMFIAFAVNLFQGVMADRSIKKRTRRNERVLDMLEATGDSVVTCSHKGRITFTIEKTGEAYKLTEDRETVTLSREEILLRMLWMDNVTITKRKK